jgi:hypothetical protein
VTIDQIRLRRATNLPLRFQNFSSSGFQSEIQVSVRSSIGDFPSLNDRERPGAFIVAKQKAAA